MINTTKIDELIQNEIAAKRLGGAQIYLYQNGQILMDKEYGSTRKDDIFRIYSMSKIVTMIGVMLLIQDGLLNLKDPVSKYLPSFAERVVYDASGNKVKSQLEMKISDLLNMTSGLGYPLENLTDCDRDWIEFEKKQSELCKSDNNHSMIDFCNMAGTIPGAFEPGTRWKYGASADILGAIIEVVSGKPFDAFLKERIFAPLEMEDTEFYLPKDKSGRIAKMYTRDENTGTVSELPTIMSDERDITCFTLPDTAVIRRVRPFLISGGAGLYCTTKDYAKILHLLLNGGEYKGKHLIDKSTYETIITPQLPEEVTKTICSDNAAGFALAGYTYSNLIRILLSPDTAKDYGYCGSEGEFGWEGLPGNYCLVDSKEKIVLLFMIQIKEGPSVPFRAELRKLIYSKY